jgi:hypothetical protein
MPPISRVQAGDVLAIWLGKNSVDPAVLKQIVAETNYKDSPWFGANKKKVRLVGEIVMANSALVIFAVNQIFAGQDAKAIIDAFLGSANKSVFSLLEVKDKGFKQRYEERMGEYFEALHGEQPGVAVSFIFMKNLNVDPLKNLKGQVLVAARFGQSLSRTLGVLRTFTLATTGTDAIAQLRAIARP